MTSAWQSLGLGSLGRFTWRPCGGWGCPVRGILGCDDAESKRAMKAIGLPKAYGSLDEVLADPTVQAVHLAVPNVLHYEFAKRAITAGKHVLCEKPLAMNSEQSGELVELAKGKKLAAAVCYNVRFYPLNLEARDRVARGEVGQIFAVNGSYTQDWLFYDTDYNWRVLSDQGGALRAVADIGTHWMDLVDDDHRSGAGVGLRRFEHRASDPQAAKGRSRDLQRQAGHRAADRAGRHRHRGLRLRCCSASREAPAAACGSRRSPPGGRTAFATRSPARKPRWPGTAKRRTRFGSATATRPNESLIRDPSLVGQLARSYLNYPGGHNEGFPDAFKQCFRSFYNYIAAGDYSAEPLYPTFAQGHREVLLCEAILKSHQQQAWVRV